MIHEDELREIDSLGAETPEEIYPEPWEKQPEKAGWGGVPLLQAVLCALVIGALVFFQFCDTKKYQEFSQWYRKEMSQEIELPQLERSVEFKAPSEPSTEASRPPATVTQPDNGPLQLL